MVGVIFTTIMTYIFNAVAIAVLIGITVAVGKFAFEFIKDIAFYVWRTIHRKSYESFLNKQKSKKVSK